MKNQGTVLSCVRKALLKVEKQKDYTSTHERYKAAPIELLPQDESQSIMEKLMVKMIQQPSQKTQEREKELNKKIEKVFELDAF